MENNVMKYREGDYVNLRVKNDEFRGRIIRFISESKESAPTKAEIEVSACTKKSAEVSISIMEVNLSQLSPLL